MPTDERSAADQLADVRAVLARMGDPEPEPPAEATAGTPPTTLIEALHPGAVPVLGADGEKAFDAALQASADQFWTGWTS